MTARPRHPRPASEPTPKARTGAPYATTNKYQRPDAQYAPPPHSVDDFNAISDHGGLGRPEMATPEKGQKFFDGFAREIVEFLDEFAKW